MKIPFNLTLNVVEDLIQICYYAYQRNAHKLKLKKKLISIMTCWMI